MKRRLSMKPLGGDRSMIIADKPANNEALSKSTLLKQYRCLLPVILPDPMTKYSNYS